MRKIWIISLREYFAAVKTKGFLIGVTLIPVMMVLGVFLQKAADKVVDLDDRRVAVIDHTAGQKLYDALRVAGEDRNRTAIYDKSTPPRQILPKFEFYKVDPPPTNAQADAQRFELSEKIRRGELFAYVEIGEDILNPKIDLMGMMEKATQASSDAGDDAPELDKVLQAGSLIYYTSNRPTYMALHQFVQKTLTQPIYIARLSRLNLNVDTLKQIIPPAVLPRGMASKLPSGQISYESQSGQVASVIVPVVLMSLLLVVVMVGASPLTTNVIEEKQLRIAEVLVGSVSPFQLMMGKLLGGVATSLTLGVFYLGGAIATAYKLDVLQYLTVPIMLWFVLFSAIASCMYGAMFIIAGAGASNIKEAQALVTPVMLIVVMPLFLAGHYLNDPNGTIAKIGTFFPFSAPLVTMLRVAMPQGLPLWQPLLAAALSLMMTFVLIWIAGRVFRIGFLMTGRAASIKELLYWIIRG